MIAADRLFDWEFLEQACRQRSIADYFWLTLDSLAKGAVLDVLESFHLDIYACAPNRQSFAASMAVFAIRTFTSFILVYGLLQIYRERRQREIVLGA